MNDFACPRITRPGAQLIAGMLVVTENVHVPDYVGEVTGYRSWGIDSNSLLRGPRLVSLNYPTVWEPDQWLVATCTETFDGDEVPHEQGAEHRCGTYAAFDRTHLASFGYNLADTCYWTQARSGVVLCLGEVGLSGKIITGELGWRAAKGRPLRVWLPHRHWRLAKPLSDTYGIPVLLTNPYREDPD